MTFLAPIWLFGLLPWLAVTVWLLLGRRRRLPVPFLPLWRGPVHAHRVLQAPQRPPLALVLALAALLLAILAAARPILPGQPGGNQQTLTIIVDCGATMSAIEGAKPRFAELADAVRQPLLQSFGSGPVDLIDVPGGPTHHTDRDHWADVARQFPPTGLATAGLLRTAVTGLLAQQTSRVVLLSDQHLDIDDARLLQIPPAAGVEHVGIVKLAVREGQQPQAMVTLRNQSDRKTATLTASSGAWSGSLPITLPARGSEQNYFIDLPAKLADVIEAEIKGAEIKGSDPISADQRAWVVRELDSPRLEAGFALPEALERMVELYQKQHPPLETAPRVALVRDFADLPSGQAGIAIAAPDATASAPPPGTEVRLEPHPITANLKAGDFAGARLSERAPTAAGWQTLIRIGPRSAVMVRTDARPQVWIGFDSPTWDRTTAFVVFWTNVFDWISGQEKFASYPLAQWTPQWQARHPQDLAGPPGLWPGLYRDSAGELRAFNTLDLHTPAPPTASWPRMSSSQRHGIPVAAALLLAALTALVLAVLTWRRRPV